jgi:hypothetical protein
VSRLLQEPHLVFHHAVLAGHGAGEIRRVKDENAHLMVVFLDRG